MGVNALTEALKINTMLKELSVEGENANNKPVSLLFHLYLEQRIILETSEQLR